MITLLDVILENSSVLVEFIAITTSLIALTEWRLKSLLKPYTTLLKSEIKKGHEEHTILFNKIDELDKKLWEINKYVI